MVSRINTDNSNQLHSFESFQVQAISIDRRALYDVFGAIHPSTIIDADQLSIGALVIIEHEIDYAGRVYHYQRALVR